MEVGSGLLVSFVLLAISAVGTFPLMVWIEEHELEKDLGSAFVSTKLACLCFLFHSRGHPHE